jgi:hypothetical protein
VLLFKTGLLPDALKDTVFRLSEENLNTLHIVQELGSLLVLAGLLTFWFLRHYEQSLFFHWAMTAFWALIALVHWFDVRGPAPLDVGLLVNTAPFVLFLSIGVLRAAAEGCFACCQERRADAEKQQGELALSSTARRGAAESSEQLR